MSGEAPVDPEKELHVEYYHILAKNIEEVISKP